MKKILKTTEKELRKKQELIYKKQQKEIEDLYIDISSTLFSRLEKLDENTFTEADLHKLKRELKNDIKKNRKEVNQIINNNISITVGASALVHKKFFALIDKKYGTNLASEYIKKTSNVKSEVKKKIKEGTIYRDNYKLSQRIWSDNKKVIGDINKIINEGLKNKTNPYNIAKDLEKYVNPKHKKDWSWGNIYPGVNKKVDYNAQRLARTTITHAHQLGAEAYAKKNPFIEYLEYNSAHNNRTCGMCADRDGQLFKKDEAPLDHPNGNCFMTIVVPDNITDLIADYVNEGNLENIFDDIE